MRADFILIPDDDDNGDNDNGKCHNGEEDDERNILMKMTMVKLAVMVAFMISSESEEHSYKKCFCLWDPVF